MTIAILLFRFKIFIVYYFIEAPGRMSLNLYIYLFLFIFNGWGGGGGGGEATERLSAIYNSLEWKKHQNAD